eukprot:s3371_g5.t1
MNVCQPCPAFPPLDSVNLSRSIGSPAARFLSSALATCHPTMARRSSSVLVAAVLMAAVAVFIISLGPAVLFWVYFNKSGRPASTKRPSWCAMLNSTGQASLLRIQAGELSPKHPAITARTPARLDQQRGVLVDTIASALAPKIHQASMRDLANVLRARARLLTQNEEMQEAVAHEVILPDCRGQDIY